MMVASESPFFRPSQARRWKSILIFLNVVSTISEQCGGNTKKEREPEHDLHKNASRGFALRHSKLPIVGVAAQDRHFVQLCHVRFVVGQVFPH